MTDAIRQDQRQGRDWLAELRAADDADDGGELFTSLVIDVALAEPELEVEVLELVRERRPEWEEWARGRYVLEKAARRPKLELVVTKPPYVEPPFKRRKLPSSAPKGGDAEQLDGAIAKSVLGAAKALIAAKLKAKAKPEEAQEAKEEEAVFISPALPPVVEEEVVPEGPVAAEPKSKQSWACEEPSWALDGLGLVGELAEFAMQASMYPSKKFTVNMSMSVIGTLIGRRIAGPPGSRGCGTHSYRGIIGPSSFGKEIMRTVSKAVLMAVGAGGLIGPGGFKSGAGIIKHLKKKPLSLCVMDEFGSSLAQYRELQAQSYVRDITKVLREIWGMSWSRFDSEEGAKDDSMFVVNPALSILAMAVPLELYSSCKSTDVVNGFLNRWTFAEEKVRAPEQRVPEDALELPKRLREGLARLYQPASVLDATGKPAFRMPWGAGAEEVYRAIQEEVEAITDERRKVLFSRAPEKAARDATTIAAGFLDKFVQREYIERTREWTWASDESLWQGFLEYGDEEKLDFSNLCREIIRRIRRAGGKMTLRQLRRSFQNNLKRKYDLDQALDQLVETNQLIEHRVQSESGIGRPSIHYELSPKAATEEVT